MIERQVDIASVKRPVSEGVLLTQLSPAIYHNKRESTKARIVKKFHSNPLGLFIRRFFRFNQQ